MARRLRAWSDPTAPPSARASNNARINVVMNRNVQGIRNKRLKSRLNRAENRYTRQESFIRVKGQQYKKQAASLKGYAKDAERAAAAATARAQGYANEQAALTSRYEQSVKDLKKQYRKGEINKKQYERYAARGKRQYESRYNQLSANIKGANSGYEGALAAYKAQARNVKRGYNRYQRQYRKLDAYKARWQRAASAYEAGYIPVSRTPV